VVSAADSSGTGGAHDAFARLPPGEIGEPRVAGGQHEGDHVLSVESAIGGRLGRRGELAFAQTGQLVRGVEHDGEVVGVGEEVLLEARGERGQALVVLAQPLLVRLVEPCAGKGELGVIPLDEVA